MTRAISARRDDGFTVVELVIAAAILFFAMTALVGLLSASTQMTASAKSRSVLTNTIASELEQIRTLDIDNVAYDTAGGSVPHTKVITTQDGVTVTLSFTITDRMSQNNTKEVTVRGVAIRPGFAPARFSSFAVIRDRIGGRTREGTAGGPLIEFDEDTPDVGSVLDGSKIGGTSTDIVIKAHAWSESGANIVRFEYTVDGIDNATGSKAALPLKQTNTVYPGALSSHDVDPGSPDESWAFSWNTNQRDSANLPEVPDGIRTVTIIAYDDQNRASPPVKRWFLVDNYEPKTAPPTTLVRRDNADFTQSVALSWTSVLDGDYSADHYVYELRRKTTSSQDIKDWDAVSVTAGSYDAVAQPLAYYVARVQARSKLNKDELLSPWGYSAGLLTSPILSGKHDVLRVKHNASNDKWTFTSRFAVAKPDVPCTVSSVIIERTGGATGAATLDITTAAKAAWSSGPVYYFEEALSQTIKKSSSPVPPEYRLTVTLTPAGTSTALTASSQYARCQVPDISNTSPAATNLQYVQRW